MKKLLSLGFLLAASTFAVTPSSFAVKVTGKGPAMILIPGLSSSGAVWDTTVARFQDRYQCHVLTLAGFAGVPPVDGLTLDRVRQDIVAYVREQKLSKPVLTGHSLGGFIAMWIAATEPAAVGRVIVVDSLPFLPAAWMPGATVDSVKDQAASMQTMMGGMSAEAWAKYQRSNPALKMMITSPKDIEVASEWGVNSSPKMVAQSMYDLFQTDLRPELSKIKAPVVILAALNGLPDAAVSNYQDQFKTLAGVKIVPFPDSKHFIMYDDLNGMLKAMESFLEESR